MLPFEKAFEIVIESARQLGTERVDYDRVLNRILAEDVVSDTDVPPFNKSAMDGYACRRTDLGNELRVLETVAAGHIPQSVVEENRCVKIMTGGVVPAGADCVIMKEYVEAASENTICFVGDETADNICRQGEDIKASNIILRKGAKLGPQHIAVLASVGNAKPLVAKKASVGVIATGSELVEPACKPQFSQIRNSNSYQLTAQIQRMGAVATNYGIARDTTGEINSVFKKAAEQNDVVIVSGGVSEGDFDFVPGIFKQNNIDLLFERVAIKPGKPTVFGVSDKLYCFGLPGNPVSTFVLFEILVKPFLHKLMGHDYKPLNVQMPLDESLILKKAKRQRWLPVRITSNATLKLVEYHGSAHISALCGADGLVCFDTGITEAAKGMSVAVRLI